MCCVNNGCNSCGNNCSSGCGTCGNQCGNSRGGNTSRCGCASGCGSNTCNGCGSGCGNSTRNGCGSGCGNSTRNGCGSGCGNSTRNGCGSGCGNSTRNGCGSGCGTNCNSGCNSCGNCSSCGCPCNCLRTLRPKGASFIAPNNISVLSNHAVVLYDDYIYSDGEITHEFESPIVRLSAGLYEISYSFNALAPENARLQFALDVNGTILNKSSILEDVAGGRWNSFSKTFNLGVVEGDTPLMVINLTNIGIEINEFNLIIKKISNELA